MSEFASKFDQSDKIDKMGSTAKCCGICRFHNVYEHPEKVFCISRFVKRLNPIVSTLWRCNDWKPNIQECFPFKKQLERIRTEETLLKILLRRCT